MATQVICKFNQYGYCRYKEMCRKQHINEKCENSSCERKACSLRHPKLCKFFRENGFCKFGEWCKFIHFEKENNLDNYEKENEFILEKLANIDKKLENLQQCEEEILNKKFFDVKMSKLESIIAEKDARIYDFVEKINEMEANIDTLDNTNTVLKEKLEAIEKEMEETNTKKDDTTKLLEKRIYILERRRLGYDFCDYCEIEFILGSEKDRKEKETHIRNNHTFECSVCDFKLQNKEELVIHLSTCEIYVCSLCSYRHKRISELKNHCKTKHTKNIIIKHKKMDRENFTKVSSTNYFSEEI